MELTDAERAAIIADVQALTDMPREERRAAELLKELLGGDYKPRDVGGAQGMHDFDLRLNDGRTIAVEVTTDTSRVDKAFQNQTEQSFVVQGLTRVWSVYCAVPGSDADDQPASAERVAELKSELPDILQELERAGSTQLDVPPSPHHDNHAAHAKLRELGVQMCYSFDASPSSLPRVMVHGPAVISGATGPGLIVGAVNQNLPNKVGKLINAKTAGANEVHLFLWLIYAQYHKRGRAEAMSSLRHTGLGVLERPNLQGIDAVWVAVDIGPEHDPYCQHFWPILCCDADGWHDWQIRKSR